MLPQKYNERCTRVDHVSLLYPERTTYNNDKMLLTSVFRRLVTLPKLLRYGYPIIGGLTIAELFWQRHQTT